MSTYHGGDLINRAQAALDRHAVLSGNGMCVSCGVPGPCAEHEAAAKVFTVSLRLPRRVPGATRPELVGARRIG